MKPAVKTTCLLIMLILYAPVIHASTDCIRKEILPVNHGSTLKVVNKYGDINLITGKKDSIAFCVDATIDAENRDLIRKSLLLIKVETIKTGDTIIVRTSFDKKFFTPAFSNRRKSFNVNYTIEVPEYTNTILTNSFGNISMEKITGYVNIDLSRGNLYVKELTRGNTKPVNSVTVFSGELTIDKSDWITLNLTNCPSARLGNMGAAVIKSGFSKIRIDDIRSIVIDSKSDRYTIKNAGKVLNESSYTEIIIDNLMVQLESKSSFGSIYLNKPDKPYKSADITSDHTPVIIVTGSDPSFKAEITVKTADVLYPERLRESLIKTKIQDVTYLGGTTNDKPASEIKIRAVSANVTFK